MINYSKKGICCLYIHILKFNFQGTGHETPQDFLHAHESDDDTLGPYSRAPRRHGHQRRGVSSRGHCLGAILTKVNENMVYFILIAVVNFGF